jgi:hypothetical protein
LSSRSRRSPSRRAVFICCSLYNTILESQHYLARCRKLYRQAVEGDPEATDVSALDHILGGQQTMTTDKGLFLEETWRAPPGEASSARRAGLMGKPRSRANEQR